MQKVKISRNDLQGYRHIVKIPYCDAHYLLAGIEPWGYNRGVYGWNYDAYDFGDVCIITGYRMRAVHGEYYRDTVREYEARAKKIYRTGIDTMSMSWNEIMQEIAKLRNDFLATVRG